MFRRRKREGNVVIRLIVGIGLGMVLGLWIGVNIGRQQPWSNNPFRQPTLGERLQRDGGKLIQRAGQAIDRAGQQLQNPGH